MKRRSFLNYSAAGGLGLLLPICSCSPDTQTGAVVASTSELEAISSRLLKTWCDAMIRDQINDPADPVKDGALWCHACDLIHGRCHDAVYPFMYMADTTGEKKYLDAAIKVMKWSENVDRPDGSWTNMLDPKSWNGTTVFGAISLGEALHYHGHILPTDLKTKWEKRLKRAIEFVYDRFDMNFSHINYRFTAIYALHFLGKYFNEEKYLVRSKEFADQIPNWLTEPNKIIFGEDKPDREKSAKGFYPVDLGYNVEESINGVVQYAIDKKDEELLSLLTESMESHLEFMLPDGAWDNSWGTRHNKWTYWGSRTTDGCQPAFVLMADRNPAFGTAALLSTQLLEQCTVDGLLAGGPHYESYGELPCMHHTFAHAKSLAYLMDHRELLTGIDGDSPVPRSTNDGVIHFSELDVWLGAKGPWRCTVSAYDQIWKKKYSVPGIGGSLSVLWHAHVGPLFAASMAEYIEVEPYNQQPQPGEDFCLTPRVERYVGDTWYTSAHDLKAKVAYTDRADLISFGVDVTLTDRDKNTIEKDGGFKMNYMIGADAVTIRSVRNSKAANGDTLVLPVISPSDDEVVILSDTHFEIKKENQKISIESTAAMRIKESEKSRIFNQVPGVEVLPILVAFPEGVEDLSVTIKIV